MRFKFLIMLLVSTLGFGANLMPQEVTGLVKSTCETVKSSTKVDSVFSDIIAGKHPYKDKVKPDLYVFVYNENVDIVAHPKKSLVGKNYKGKTDPRGNAFRDKIVSGAIANGQGWELYVYKKLNDEKLYKKKAYYELCENAGKKYIVVAGMYR